MQINILNKISLLKAAGINKFITVDIGADMCKAAFFKRKEPIYNISNKIKPGEIVLIHSFIKEFQNDYREIISEISTFVQKNNWDNAVVLIGINEFKFNTIAIPKDEEDKDLWFLENSSKFLPDTRNSSKFIYSYERYYEDDNFDYYVVVVARDDYLTETINSFAELNLKVINCSPFLFSITPEKEEDSKNYLSINIDKHCFSYFIIMGEQNALYDEYYFKSSEASDLRIGIKNQITKLIQNLKTQSGDIKNRPLNISLSGNKENTEFCIESLKSVYNRFETNKYGIEGNSEFTHASLTLCKLIERYDNSVNFIKEEAQNSCITEIEKQISLRYVLSGGALIFLLVLLSFSIDRYLTGSIQNEKNNLAELKSVTEMVENTQKGNTQLTKNLNILRRLRSDRDKQSQLLEKIPAIINDNTFLTSFNSKELNRGLQIIMTGISTNQENIANFINRLEQSNKFKNISLLYSSLIKNNVRYKGMTQFKISAMYNDF